MVSTRKTQSTSRSGPRIGVAVLVWKQGRVLLGKRAATTAEGTWQFPGGHLENGETVTECALREVLEETGLQVADARHAAFTDRVFSMGGHDYITLYITARYVAGEPRVMEPDKCACWQWFSTDELPSPLFAPISILLAQVCSLDELQVDRGVPSTWRK